MRKNQANYSISFRGAKLLSLGLLLVSLVACATAPKDKAKLQDDKDWTQAVANAEKDQQLQLMLQGSSPTQTRTSPSLAPAHSPEGRQAIQPLLTSEEYRRQEIERREEVYAKEWRILEHEIAKRVLQRSLPNLEAAAQPTVSSTNPSLAGQSRCREWKSKGKHMEYRWDPYYRKWFNVLVERWGWVGVPCNY
jgi:hypothetical protein